MGNNREQPENLWKVEEGCMGEVCEEIREIIRTLSLFRTRISENCRKIVGKLHSLDRKSSPGVTRMQPTTPGSLAFDEQISLLQRAVPDIPPNFLRNSGGLDKQLPTKLSEIVGNPDFQTKAFVGRSERILVDPV